MLCDRAKRAVVLIVFLVALATLLGLFWWKYIGLGNAEETIYSYPSCIITSCSSILPSNVSVPLQDNSTFFLKLIQENCTMTQDNSTKQAGVTAVFCQPKSNISLLLSATRAEDAEFPHQAYLESETGGCAATIYNNRYLITAAHCVVHRDVGQVVNISTIKVTTGTNFKNFAPSPEFVYKVKRVIPHPEYGGLVPSREWLDRNDQYKAYHNDIALLELDLNITFSDSVKALRIAPKDFDPFKFANTTVVVGWGITDIDETTQWLQKSNFLLQPDEPCFEICESHVQGKDRLLCAGGTAGEYLSGVTGAGDSGGPAICRDDNERPVLCGVVSFRVFNENKTCHKSQEIEHCFPSMFVKAAYFHQWIIDIAGVQDENVLIKQTLYGKTTDVNKFLHQVRIFSTQQDNDEKRFCSGTLIELDIVITDADCVFGENLTLSDITVSVSNQDNTFGLKAAKVLPIFENDKVSRRKRAYIGVEDQVEMMEIDKYFNAMKLAVVLLNESVPLHTSELLKLPEESEVFLEGQELSFHFDESFRSRKFSLLTRDECQKRMTGLNVTIQESILCGVEKYSGGSICDRGYGGGLICQRENGQAVLCGIAIYRWCTLTFPDAFVNVAHQKARIQTTIQDLRLSENLHE